MLLNLIGQNASVLGRARYFFWVRHHGLTLRIFLIVLCVSLTLVTTVLLNEDLVLGIMPFVALAAIGGLLFVYYNLEASLLLLLAVTMLLHDGIGTGTGTKITFTFIFLTVVSGIWLFRMTMAEKSFALRSSPANLPALLFIFVVVIATVWSDIFVENKVHFIFQDKLSTRIMSAMALVLAPAAYYLYANHIRSLRSMRFFVWWFIIVGAVFIIMFVTGIGLPEPLNAKGLFASWVGAFCIGQVAFNKAHKPYLKVILILIALGWLYQIAGLGISWLSGWLPLTLVFMTLVFLRSRKLFFVLLAILLVFGLGKFESIRQAFDSENAESGETRLEAWGRTLDLTTSHVLFGTGPAGYQMYFSTYVKGFYQLSHNNYIDIIAQTGVIGIGVFIWFWISVGLVVVRTYRITPRGGFHHALSASLLAAYGATITAMMLGDWVTPFAYTQTLAGIDYTIWAWMLAGLAVALHHEIRENNARQQAPSVLAASAQQI